MSALRCTAEPVSWLRLEQHHLGELPAAVREAVARHVEACAACRACLARVEADDGVALPPLTLPAKTAPRGRARGSSWGSGSAAFAALAAAAVVAVVRTPAPLDGPPGARAKGGAIAFALVRENGARLDEVGATFRDGDRFKAVVTCPPAVGGHPWFDLVVFDREGASFPLEATAAPACGNDRPLRGAFRLTGRAHESVCLVWSDDGPIDRGALSRTAHGDLATSPQASCEELEPAEP
ncbi:MAG TPA: hypothetical protein VHV30_06265 [Polyangiaceae bacterium]|nr:hypothetical protein [Polyangiaceae bacterium]